MFCNYDDIKSQIVPNATPHDHKQSAPSAAFASETPPFMLRYFFFTQMMLMAQIGKYNLK